MAYTYTKVKNSGFQLNLVVFSLGRKKTVTEVFSSVMINEERARFGEISAEIRHLNPILNTTSAAMTRISNDYLDDDFLFQLYFNPILQTLEDYGGFVITNYITGGRASALFYGEGKLDSSAVSNKKDFEYSMGLAFGWNADQSAVSDSVAVKLTFGSKGSSVGTTHEEQSSIEDVFMQIRTLGGGYNYSLNTGTTTYLSASYDLSSWLASLNSEENHTMIEISDEGLLPISYYLLEENFKQRMQDTHLGFLQKQNELQDPFIEVVKVRVHLNNSEELFDVLPVLNTRHGDKIILGDGKSEVRAVEELRANLNNSTYLAKAQSIANLKKEFYGVKMSANYSTKVTSVLRDPLVLSFNTINERGMYKYRNTNSNMWYIYDPVNLAAFSYYDDGDYIPYCYGMLDWIDGLPEKTISMTILSQKYKIIGL